MSVLVTLLCIGVNWISTFMLQERTHYLDTACMLYAVALKHEPHYQEQFFFFLKSNILQTKILYVLICTESLKENIYYKNIYMKNLCLHT